MAGADLMIHASEVELEGMAVLEALGLGTPALTTRGMRQGEMHTVARLIHRILTSRGDAAVLQEVRRSVADLAAGFPLYAERLASYASS